MQEDFLINSDSRPTTQILESDLRWREQTESDILFALELFILHRWNEMSLIPTITDEQRYLLLYQQALLQQRYYKDMNPMSEMLIIEHLENRVGRLYIDRHTNMNWHIIDICLLPAVCGQGIGTTLIKKLINKADHAGSPCSLYVRNDNPAQRLYHRLGFRTLPSSALELDLFLVRPMTVCM